MRFYNYRTRAVGEFRPIRAGEVGLYACGPTVYDAVHIGNLRTYIFEDVLKRALKMEGYRVRHVMNITDIDDKIIIRAAELETTPKELAARYEERFKKDLDALNIEPADTYPRATKFIEEMKALIVRLIERGYAYEKDGSAYFDISKYADYGALSRLDKQQLKAGARVDVDEYAKDAAQDFVLWKAKKDGEPFWPSPWGEGRPGWHIECSAMSTKELGQPFDIHAGGIDLLFPHHENEIAQSVAADPERRALANFFVEGEHLMVDGKKMSKSLGNIVTLDDIGAKKFPPLAFRYFCFQAHYRSPLNFTWGALQAATDAYWRIVDGAWRVLDQSKNDCREFQGRFAARIADDLDTPQALGALWDHFSDLSYEDFKWADRILGLGLTFFEFPDDDVKRLKRERDAARAANDWERADRLRDEILERGWIVDDLVSDSILRPRH